MKRLITVLGLAAAALSAVPATAQSAEQAAKAKEMFTKADANGDGAISLEEWKAAGRRERGFSMIDADKDGKVTPEDLRAAAAKRGK
ncbi:hypothetical protein [Novosphingobium resinovorum]|uniref:hypothetical protein n=1 Tax=Novosphingobium resinovorum TaxID=158500 RepID=UPI002ED0312D|nr:hypothetical protein [Novosphingobium resinovorum]